jgi:hypothetical protein
MLTSAFFRSHTGMFICLLFSLNVLGIEGASQRKLHSAELKPAKRIDTILRIIQRNAKVPSKILETDFAEYKKGDGPFGPSDFFFYARIKVAKEDFPQWTKGLKKPYNDSTTYSIPPQKEKWWISEKDFKKLELYETKKYFGRFNGWIGFDESTGYLYVHTFTL